DGSPSPGCRHPADHGIPEPHDHSGLSGRPRERRPFRHEAIDEFGRHDRSEDHDHRSDRPQVRRCVGDAAPVGRRRAAAPGRAALLDRHRARGRSSARGAAGRRVAGRRLRLLHRVRGAEAAQPRRQCAGRGDHREHGRERLEQRHGRGGRGQGRAGDRAGGPGRAGGGLVRQVRRRLALRGPRPGVRRGRRLRRGDRGRRPGPPGGPGEGHRLRRRPRPDDVPLL
ncbi:MAG: hypothetical protein AVDCRST_MAG57-1701, partial [uncultured Blastococcus sp.]